MRRNRLIQIVVAFVLLNIIHLSFFASFPSETRPEGLISGFGTDEQSLVDRQLAEAAFDAFVCKPWPELASYTSWTPNLTLDEQDCEYYFGNGFTQQHDILARLPYLDDANLAGAGGLGPDSGPAEHKDLSNAPPDRRERSLLTGSPRPASPEAHARQLQQEAGEQMGRKAGAGAWGKGRSPGDLSEPGDSVSVTQVQMAGSFKCVFSRTLRTSVCEGTRIMMDVEKLKMSQGGEPVADVIGRPDEDELPSFSPGAFAVVTDRHPPSSRVFDDDLLHNLMPQGQIFLHTMRALLQSLHTKSPDEELCSLRVREPTLFVTRFEYANLFHTVTDWYSAYVASKVAGLEERPRLILLDGHCQSPLDDGWEAMFCTVSYAMHMRGRVCFDRAIFVPLGYETAIFKGLQTGLTCQGCAPQDLQSHKADRHVFTTRLREFGEFFVASFNEVEISDHGKQDDVNIKVLFVRREDYLAHPRHSGRPETRLNNEEEVYTALKDWAAARSGLENSTSSQSAIGYGLAQRSQKVSIINGVFAHMKLEEQVQAVQDAAIIVAAHGAGLTHIVFAKPGTVVIELLTPQFLRPHFAYIAQWMGFRYAAIQLPSSAAEPSGVVEMLDGLLNQLMASQSGSVA